MKNVKLDISQTQKNILYGIQYIQHLLIIVKIMAIGVWKVIEKSTKVPVLFIQYK